MKKYLILLSVLFLSCFSLSACTHNSNDVNEQAYTLGSEKDENDLSKETSKSTSDPLKVIRDGSYEFFQHGSTELEFIGRYSSEDSDADGMVELEKNGYKARFALILLHNAVVDDSMIYVLGKQEEQE